MTIRYSWWGAEDRAERINRTIALFEEKYPKIKVKTDFQPYADFWKKFNTQASGGNPPDVFQNAIGFLREYDAKNVLLDLSRQVEAKNLSMDGFLAGLEKFGDPRRRHPVRVPLARRRRHAGQAAWSIVLPVCRPALIASAVFTFVNAWNDFMGPLIYRNEPGKCTVSLGLKMFVDQEGLANYGGMIAMSLVALLPVLAFFLAFRRRLIDGMATSGLKGRGEPRDRSMTEARAESRPEPGESRFSRGFALSAECPLTGVWIALAALPLDTCPAAFAAGARHLRRRLAHERGGLREFAAAFRAAVRRGWLVGVVGWAALAVVWVDVRSRTGLPAGRTAGRQRRRARPDRRRRRRTARGGALAPGTSWRAPLVRAGRHTVLDPAGSFLLVGGPAVVARSAWFSAPLAVAVLGAVAAAAVTAEERHRRR